MSEAMEFQKAMMEGARQAEISRLERQREEKNLHEWANKLIKFMASLTAILLVVAICTVILAFVGKGVSEVISWLFG